MSRTATIDGMDIPEEPRGVVWIAALPREDSTDQLFFDGYWDWHNRVEEQGPSWTDPHGAVAWGLERTPVVFIRFEGESEYRMGGSWGSARETRDLAMNETDQPCERPLT